MSAPKLGHIGWHDLTVPNADEVRDFYEAVLGWTRLGVDMGEYQDWAMLPPGGKEPVGGVCHARGSNSGIPPCWLMYVTVADLDASMAATEANGGGVVSGPRDMGPWGRMAIVRDPAGAHVAIIQPPLPSAVAPKPAAKRQPKAAAKKPSPRPVRGASTGARSTPKAPARGSSRAPKKPARAAGGRRSR